MVLKTEIKEINLLRTKETMKKYFDYLKDVEKKIKNGDEVKSPFADIEERAIKSFKYWVIVDNNFHYDAIAEVSHLLLTKREVAFSWKLLTEEEKRELEEIKSDYLAENYDTVMENLPKIQSAPGHFHLQLLKFKMIKTEEFFA